MKQTDKVIVAILSIWTFIHCYLMLIANNYPEKPLVWMTSYGKSEQIYFKKTELFYPFTEINNYPPYYYLSLDFDLRFYDYSEFFVYVAGTWLCFLLYKLLSPKK
jgi:hypothetical protein